MSEATVPLGLWTSAPTHNITSVLTTPMDTVATGSFSGEICIWKHRPTEKRLEPSFFLVGSSSDTSSPIVTLQHGTLHSPSGESLPVIVSLTRNAQLKVWASDDGLCLGECRDIAKVMDIALCMTVCTPPRDTSVAIVGGASQYVCFVNLATRQLMATCRVHNDWVSQITSVYINRTMLATFVTSSNDGTISLWNAPLSYDNGFGVGTEQEPIAVSSANFDDVYNGVGQDPGDDNPPNYDNDRSVMELMADAMSTRRRVVSLSLSPDASLIAVMFPSKVVVLDADNLKRLCEIVPPAPLGVPGSNIQPNPTSLSSESKAMLEKDSVYARAIGKWGGGMFIANSTFVAWTQLGIGCVYNLSFSAVQPPLSPAAAADGISSSPLRPIPLSLNKDKLNSQLLYCTEPPVLPSRYNNTQTQPNTLKFFGWSGDVFSRQLCLGNGETVAFYDLPFDAPSSPFSSTKTSSIDPTPATPTATPKKIEDGALPIESSQGKDGQSSSSTNMAASPCSFDAVFDSRARIDSLNRSLKIPPLPRLPPSDDSSSPVTPTGTEPIDSAGWKKPLLSEAVRPAMTGTFSSVWRSVEDEWKSVTSLCLLEDLFVLICGHLNGDISCHTLPSDAFPKRIHAHDKKVTALYAPRPQVGDKWRLVVSASDDFTIKVWRLFSFELHYCFNVHSGSVLHLVPFTIPPVATVNPTQQGVVAVDTTSLYRHSFMTIGADRCVAIFDLEKLECQHWLPGHYSPIVSVHWKFEQGYLMVTCLDSTLFVWELASNTLVCKLSGDKARTILGNYCLPMFPLGKGYQSTSPPTEDFGISADAIRLGESRGSQGRPILCIVLTNMLKLLEGLNNNGTSPFLLSRKFGWSDHGSGIIQPFVTVEPDPSRKVVTYRYPPLSMLAYFLLWGADPEADDLCRRDLLLRCPSPLFSLGLLGEGDNFTFALPVMRSGKRISAVSFSPRFTAKSMLMGVSMLKILSRIDTLSDAANRLIESFKANADHEVKISGLVEPSIESLAVQMSSALAFSISSGSSTTRVVQGDVAEAARMLISRSLAHKTSTTINTQIAEYQRLLVIADHTLDPNERGLLIAVLSLILCECGSRIDDSVARFIAERLIGHIAIDTAEKRPFFPIVIDSFVHSVNHWRRLVDDQLSPLQSLFAVAISKQTQPIDAQCAQNGFLNVGYTDPSLFSSVLSEEITKRRNQIGALTALCGFLGRWVPDLYDHLPVLTQITITALDPTSPTVRDKCIKAATGVIHNMINNYPMVAFHQDSQRIAVGATNAIFIFDIKTGQSVSCRVTGFIAAVSFSPSGKHIATYSSDHKICLWQVNGAISTLKLRYKNKTADWTVTPDHPELAPKKPSKNIKICWEMPGVLLLELPGATDVIRTNVSKNL